MRGKFLICLCVLNCTAMFCSAAIHKEGFRFSFVSIFQGDDYIGDDDCDTDDGVREIPLAWGARNDFRGSGYRDSAGIPYEPAIGVMMIENQKDSEEAFAVGRLLDWKLNFSGFRSSRTVELVNWLCCPSAEKYIFNSGERIGLVVSAAEWFYWTHVKSVSIDGLGFKIPLEMYSYRYVRFDEPRSAGDDVGRLAHSLSNALELTVMRSSPWDWSCKKWSCLRRPILYRKPVNVTQKVLDYAGITRALGLLLVTNRSSRPIRLENPSSNCWKMKLMWQENRCCFDKDFPLCPFFDDKHVMNKKARFLELKPQGRFFILLGVDESEIGFRIENLVRISASYQDSDNLIKSKDLNFMMQ